jgi:hypothetical protein
MREPNRRGRPRLDPTDPAPSVQVGLRLSTRQYDALYQRARAARMSVSEFIRQQVKPARSVAPK